MNQKRKGPKIRKELSVFDEELNLPFNPSDFLPDLPSHVKEAPTNSEEKTLVTRVQTGSVEPESHGFKV